MTMDKKKCKFESQQKKDFKCKIDPKKDVNAQMQKCVKENTVVKKTCK